MFIVTDRRISASIRVTFADLELFLTDEDIDFVFGDLMFDMKNYALFTPNSENVLFIRGYDNFSETILCEIDTCNSLNDYDTSMDLERDSHNYPDSLWPSAKLPDINFDHFKLIMLTSSPIVAKMSNLDSYCHLASFMMIYVNLGSYFKSYDLYNKVMENKNIFFSVHGHYLYVVSINKCLFFKIISYGKDHCKYTASVTFHNYLQPMKIHHLFSAPKLINMLSDSIPDFVENYKLFSAFYYMPFDDSFDSWPIYYEDSEKLFSFSQIEC